MQLISQSLVYTHAHYVCALYFLVILRELHLKPKICIFMLVLKLLSTPLWKIIHASFSKLPKELKLSSKIELGQAVLELLIKTVI